MGKKQIKKKLVTDSKTIAKDEDRVQTINGCPVPKTFECIYESRSNKVQPTIIFLESPKSNELDEYLYCSNANCPIPKMPLHEKCMKKVKSAVDLYFQKTGACKLC